MRQRFIAVAVVVASACTALYSTTEQSVVAVSNNPYVFPGPGTMMFTVSPASPYADDLLMSVVMNSCTSQWLLMLDTFDVLPTRICSGSGSGSGSGCAVATDDGVSTCPHTYTFGVSFAGTQPGTSSCNITITSMPYGGGSAEYVTLMLSGMGSGGSGISVTPTTIDFQDVQAAATSAPQTVTVKNLSTFSGATVMGTLTGSAFAVSPSITSFGLASGASAYFNVTCTPPPSPLGLHTGTLSFVSGTSMGEVSLSCNGIDSGVDITPSPVTFDNTLVGRAPPQETVTITGPTSYPIDSVSLDANAIAAGVSIVSNPQGMTIGGGKNVVLAYSAATVHEAGPLGTLVVAIQNEIPRNIGISGQALLGGLSTNPASVEFGGVCLNDTAMKDIEVYASEAGDVVLQQLTKPAAPFDATAVDTLPATLSGNHTGASATVRATLKPTASGDFVEKLVLTSDVPNMAMMELQLHGVGLSEGIAATPNLVHFGAAAVGATTSVKEVQFTNCGKTDLMFSRAQITGTNAGDFTLIGTNAPRTLASTESEIFMVVMQPESSGFKTAQLVIEHGAGTTVADLDGTGEGGSAKDRETYYACSTGRGGAFWPIALALLALRRRRR